MVKLEHSGNNDELAPKISPIVVDNFFFFWYIVAIVKIVVVVLFALLLLLFCFVAFLKVVVL